MVKKPRKTFLKLLSHSTLNPLEETRQLLHLSALPDKKPFRCAVEYLRSAMIAALHPLNSLEIDLNDFDRAITFCIENRNSKEYKAEIAMLHACTRAIEADSIDAWHVNPIVAAYIDLALKNERGRKSSNAGSKEKICQPILKALQQFIEEEPDLIQQSNNAITEKFADWLPEELDTTDRECYIEHAGRDWKIFWVQGKEEKNKKKRTKCIFAEPDKTTKKSKIISVKLDAIRKNYIPKIKKVGL